MKKTSKIGLLLASVLLFSASLMSCSNGDNDPSNSNTKTKSGVTVVKADLASTTSMELENYSYKVVFSVPAAKGENWTASLAFDESDFETDDDGNTIDEQVYELGHLSDTTGTGAGTLTLYVYENTNSQTHDATLSVTYDGACTFAPVFIEC